MKEPFNFDITPDRNQTLDRKWNQEYIYKQYPLVQPGFVSSWIADLDFACPAPVVAAIEKQAAAKIYSYSFVPEAYYEAIINFNRDLYNIVLEPEWIRLVYGTVSTLHYIVQAFTEPDDYVLIQTPVYGPFGEAIEQNDRRILANKLIVKNQQYTIDWTDLEYKLQTYQPKLFIFCSPHNPGGIVWSREEIKRVLELCHRYNVLLVSDEVHRDLIFKNVVYTSVLHFPEYLQNLIFCTSLNKAFNFGGLKSSYMVIPNPTIRQRMYRQLEANAITSPNVFVVPATIAAYNECREWLSALREYLQANFEFMKQYMHQYLPKLQVMETRASFLGWINYSQYQINMNDLKTRMEEDGNLILCYGEIFVQDGEGYIRLNYGCPRATLEQILNRMRQVFEEVDHA